MKFLSIKLFVIALIMSVASSASASLSYDVAVDTSRLEGTAGYLYFQYGGINAIDSTATVSGFTGGTLDSAISLEVADGSAVTGQLPGTVVFANTHGINDYNHGILFGNDLALKISLAAPAFGGTEGGNSTISLALFADELGASPLLTSDGTLFTIDLFNDGTTSVAVLASEANVAPVPVPAAAWLLGSGLVGLAGIRRRK